MKKIIVMIVMLLLIPSTIFAESNEESITRIKLDLLNVDVPYSREDINVVYERNSTDVTAKIYDKFTNELLDEYIESVETKGHGMLRASSDYVYRTLTRTKNYGPTSVRVIARVKIYVWGIVELL